jgi:hypothetical protein
MPCLARAREPKCGSRENCNARGEAVFVNAAQSLDWTRENTCRYGETVSGPTIYAYVGGNPLSRIDPLGLADLNLFSPSERISGYANAWSAGGVYTVAAHGNPYLVMNGNTPMSASQLASRIRADPNYKGQAVMLGACNTGKRGDNGDKPFAPALANAWGASVTAPLGLAWYNSNCLMGSASSAGPPSAGDPGSWKSFFPVGP